MTGRRAAAQERRQRGMLKRARGGLGPVQRGDHPGQLIIGRPGEPVTGPGGVLGEPQQHPAARRDIQRLPGAEPARGAGVLTGNPPRRPRHPRAAAADRHPGLRYLRVPRLPRRPRRLGRLPGGLPGGDPPGLRPQRLQVDVTGQRRILRIRAPPRVALRIRRRPLGDTAGQPRLPPRRVRQRVDPGRNGPPPFRLVDRLARDVPPPGRIGLGIAGRMRGPGQGLARPAA